MAAIPTWSSSRSSDLILLARRRQSSNSKGALKFRERGEHEKHVAAVLDRHLVFLCTLARAVHLSIDFRVGTEIVRCKRKMPTPCSHLLHQGTQLRFRQFRVELQEERRRGIRQQWGEKANFQFEAPLFKVIRRTCSSDLQSGLPQCGNSLRCTSHPSKHSSVNSDQAG